MKPGRLVPRQQGKPGADKRKTIRRDIEELFDYDLSMSFDELRQTYQCNETCQENVPGAIRCHFKAQDFEDA